MKRWRLMLTAVCSVLFCMNALCMTVSAEESESGEIVIVDNDEQEFSEDSIGKGAIVVGDGVTATFDAETGAVEFYSEGGTLWKNWIAKSGISESQIQSIRVASGSVYLPEDSGRLFYNCSSLTDLDLRGFDTSNVCLMGEMFDGCSGLTSLDLSSFDTSNVVEMWEMFDGCSSLTSLDLSGFETSKVAWMWAMFRNCSSLTSLDVSNFDISGVEGEAYKGDLGGMFYNCSSLTSLDLSSFNTSNIQSFESMFSGCSNLKSLDVSNFDTSKAVTMERMFADCSSLTSLDVNNFKTPLGPTMKEMFYNCSSLTSLDLSSFDTSETGNMSNMFRNCSSLTSLNVSSFNTSHVIYMGGMFQNCSSLTSLDLSSFEMDSMEYEDDDPTGMILGCDALQVLMTPKLVENNYYTAELPKVMYDEEGNEYTKWPVTNKSITLTSTRPSIENASIATKSASYAYTGWAREPKPVIKLGGKTLVNGTDYVLSFKNNKEIGTATVTATGKGRYEGTVSCTFKIVRSDIGKGTATTKYKTYEYTGRNRRPAMILKLNYRTLVKDIDYTLTYKNNKNVGKGTVTAKGIGKYCGTISCTFYIVKEETVPIYRLFNTRTGEHFYTTSTAERQQCLNAGIWNDEGIAWYAPKTSSEPIYRVSNPNGGNEHHYTKSKSEKDWLVSLGWRYEGIAWYSDTKKTVPVYRHYHPLQRTGNHHYTTSKGESDHIVKYEGWRYEGISFYVSKAGG